MRTRIHCLETLKSPAAFLSSVFLLTIWVPALERATAQNKTNLPSLSDWPAGLDSIGVLYGQSQEGNFDQDVFVYLPPNFPLDTNWNQGTVGEASRSGGGATTPWDGTVPSGISLFITGGHYWAVSGPRVEKMKSDPTGDPTVPHVTRWRFGMHLYCGPAPPVGCNVTVGVYAKRKVPTNILLAAIACYSQESASAVILTDARDNVLVGDIVEIHEVSGVDPAMTRPYLGDSCTAPFSNNAFGRRRAEDTRLAVEVGGKESTASPETYLLWGWTVGTIAPRQIPSIPIVRLPVTKPSPLPLPTPSTPATVRPAPSQDCGSIPCVSIIANNQENCGTYGIIPAYDLVNSSTKAIVATVTVTIIQGVKRFPRNDVHILAASTSLFLGCAGDINTGQRIEYNLVGETWK
jgi:hypothetical protein